MRRRDFITLLGGAAGAPALLLPLAARAQQGERLRRIAILMGSAETALDQISVATFVARLDELDWESGRNLRTDVRWWSGTPEQMRGVIADMLMSSPSVFVVWTNLALATVQPMVVNVPVVFVGVGDPVGSGFVASLAHPGANVTGFSSYDEPMGGKWLEVIKETAPQLTRVMALLHPETPTHQEFWRAIEAAAPRLAVEVTPGRVHDASEIERNISVFAANENAGVVILPHAVTNANRDLIIALTLRHRMPAINGDPSSVIAGALVFYGIDWKDSFQHTAEYVDRILRGENPADLPVQQPTRFKLAFNLRTARGDRPQYSAERARPRRRGHRIELGTSAGATRPRLPIRILPQLGVKRRCRRAVEPSPTTEFAKAITFDQRGELCGMPSCYFR
jgi:putative ABC transport system substrate-binding protein